MQLCYRLTYYTTQKGITQYKNVIYRVILCYFTSIYLSKHKERRRIQLAAAKKRFLFSLFIRFYIFQRKRNYFFELFYGSFHL